MKKLASKLISRRSLLKSAAAGAGLLTLGTSPAFSFGQQDQKSLTKRPNILFINVDQLACETIGAHGCRYVQTPHMDRLISNGVSFQNSYSGAPVCGPARACWITGRPASEHGEVDNLHKIRPDIPDIGQCLSKAGYNCFNAGSWHILGRAEHESNMQSLGYITDTGEYNDLNLVRTAEGFFRKYRESKPFYFQVGILNPHDICFWILQRGGYTGGMPYEHLKKELPPLPPNFSGLINEPALVANRRKLENEFWGVDKWSDELWQYYQWAYYRYIEMVDECVGAILNSLERSKFRENTIVIFSSDHGEAHSHHKRITKDRLYDQECRVPFVVSWPGHFEKRIDRKTLVSGFDLFPTVCDLAGIEPPNLMRGVSLKPALNGKSLKRDFVYAESLITDRMIRTDKYKLIKFHEQKDPVFRGQTAYEFFDLEKDPYEIINLASDTKYSSEMLRHKKILEDFESVLIPAELKECSIRGT
jgi:arylsulfatase A-like enzyme